MVELFPNLVRLWDRWRQKCGGRSVTSGNSKRLSVAEENRWTMEVTWAWKGPALWRKAELGNPCPTKRLHGDVLRISRGRLQEAEVSTSGQPDSYFRNPSEPKFNMQKAQALGGITTGRHRILHQATCGI